MALSSTTFFSSISIFKMVSSILRNSPPLQLSSSLFSTLFCSFLLSECTFVPIRSLYVSFFLIKSVTSCLLEPMRRQWSFMASVTLMTSLGELKVLQMLTVAVRPGSFKIRLNSFLRGNFLPNKGCSTIA